jgi:bacillithiol biosynthesis cysteine-adding enzyme BshC
MTNPSGRLDPLFNYPFARDAIRESGGAAELLPRLSPDQMLERVTASQWTPWSETEIAELREFNLRAGNVEGARLAARLAEPDAVVVVTGQQPNLLASPLSNLLKAFTCIYHAKSLSEHCGREVIPVFWVASDDHDYSELAHCVIVGASGQSVDAGKKIGVGHLPASAAYSWRLGAAGPYLVELLRKTLGPGAHLEETVRAVAAACREDSTFESAFCNLLARYLGKHPILFVAPRLHSLRTRQLPILMRDLEVHEEAAEVIADQARVFENNGYSAMLQRSTDQLNSFVELDGVRARLRSRDSGISAQHPATGRTLNEWSKQEFEKLLSKKPLIFSPNVVTRPMLQDRALPVAAYVAGPGEMQYLAQLRSVAPRYGVNPAAILPRVFATILDGRTMGSIAGDAFDACCAEEILMKLSTTQPETAGYLVAAGHLQQTISDELDKLKSLPESANAHLARSIEKTKRSTSYSLQQFRNRVTRHFLQNGGQSWKSLSRGIQMLSPDGEIQERILSPLSFGSHWDIEEFGEAVYRAIDFSNPLPQVLRI